MNKKNDDDELIDVSKTDWYKRMPKMTPARRRKLIDKLDKMGIRKKRKGE